MKHHFEMRCKGRESTRDGEVRIQTTYSTIKLNTLTYVSTLPVKWDADNAIGLFTSYNTLLAPPSPPPLPPFTTQISFLGFKQHFHRFRGKS